jgi:hypothetical protein
MTTPTRVRTLSSGIALLLGGLLALVGLFLPWVETYYPDWNVVGNPPLPGEPIFYWSPMSFVFFHNDSVTGVASGAVFLGVVFLAPPLILAAQGLRVCVTRRWRTTGGAVAVALAAAVAELAVALLVIWQWTNPTLWLNDMGTKSRVDVGLAVVVVGYGCALAGGFAGRVLCLDG